MAWGFRSCFGLKSCETEAAEGKRLKKLGYVELSTLKLGPGKRALQEPRVLSA